MQTPFVTVYFDVSKQSNLKETELRSMGLGLTQGDLPCTVP